MNHPKHYSIKWQDDWPWRKPLPEYDLDGYRVDNTRDRAMQEWLDGHAIAIVWLMLLAIVATGGYFAYAPLNSIGWIEHTRQTTITAQATWMVGEAKHCVSDPAKAFDMVLCDGGPPRDMPVSFFGREIQPEYSAVNWNCIRDGSGFTCLEVSGNPRQ